MFMTITPEQEALAEFELWRFDGDSTEHALIPAGPRGARARALEAKGSRVVWRVAAKSHIDVMTKYYSHMGWGEYRSDWPDLDAVPFFYTYAMETLAALPKSWKPLREFKVFADGSSKPAIPGPAIPRILIQEGAVFQVDVQVFGDFGGHGEPPLNVDALVIEAQVLIERTKPHLFKRRACVSLICPKETADRMLWVSLERGI
jgi:hypothetical protein